MDLIYTVAKNAIYAGLDAKDYNEVNSRLIIDWDNNTIKITVCNTHYKDVTTFHVEDDYVIAKYHVVTSDGEEEYWHEVWE